MRTKILVLTGGGTRSADPAVAETFDRYPRSSPARVWASVTFGVEGPSSARLRPILGTLSSSAWSFREELPGMSVVLA